MKLEFNNTNGVVRLANWTIMPNGEEYLNVWCKRWEIVTDRMMPVEGFKSSEKWQLAAMVDDKVVLFIPGCQVKGWTRIDDPEILKHGRRVYVLE